MELGRGLRWWELLPEVVLGAGLGLFALTETEAAASAFRSTTAVTLMAATSVGWLAGRLLLARFASSPAVGLVVFAVAAAGVLRVVVVPAYDDTTVVETLPVAADLPPAATSTTQPAIAAPPASTPPPAPTTTAVPAAPLALRSGPLRGIDHRASGTAVVYRQPDGSVVVGLEGIDIQPGPDYDVYVVAGADREDIDGAIRLDDLRGNQGTQYYPVPGPTDVGSAEWTVLVWCETFDVPVAGATLR